ncbi:plastocyanin/azurin family copper-binding protein [Paraburkholderia sp.]|uniref:cupredoxin domain-containing protein n=1 Tax=Paraburkholderia sp. TaxID=1926495 RepID=UPI0025DF108F|nr:plastocyanin/azurin family copper-binding protein [Paraburkholderia sp.]
MLRREMMLGTAGELTEHAQMMRAMPDMVHHDANAITVDAGHSGKLVWKFTRAEKFEFACLQPGHYEAGMTGTVTVK